MRPAQTKYVLPDLLAHGLRLVICGSAAGSASARAKAYYAGPGNRFWQVLFDIGLTPRRLDPGDFRLLLDHGIGLTDMAKTVSGPDSSLPRTADAPDRLRATIRRYRPQVLAFNGKRAAAAFQGTTTDRIDYGRQDAGLGPTAIHVLPSTSAAARRYWDPLPWQMLANAVRDPPAPR